MSERLALPFPFPPSSLSFLPTTLLPPLHLSPPPTSPSPFLLPSLFPSHPSSLTLTPGQPLPLYTGPLTGIRVRGADVAALEISLVPTAKSKAVKEERRWVSRQGTGQWADPVHELVDECGGGEHPSHKGGLWGP